MNKYPLKKLSIFKILNNIKKLNLGSESLFLDKTIDRFLDEDIKSKINLPPFNNSAVDGYAILDKDILRKNKYFKIQQRIEAGKKTNLKLKNGYVARIFTGAKMPSNSRTVIMQENVNVNKNQICINKIPSKGENCRLEGEDVFKGEKIFSKGNKINKGNINIIAAIGKNKVIVKKKIKIGFYTSGNELTKPTEKLKDSKINNSNFYSLNALLDKAYIQKKYLGILKDDENLINKTLKKEINKFDIIITTGGASVGEEDHLINVIKKSGKLYFWKTAIKPGRPLAIGKIKNTVIICLPGNPVSVHLLYAMIISPFVEFLCNGKLILPKGVKVKTNFAMKKKNRRLEWIRVNQKETKNGLVVSKFPKQGSGMISSIVFSDGILEIPENIKFISKGDTFLYYSFRDLFF